MTKTPTYASWKFIWLCLCSSRTPTITFAQLYKRVDMLAPLLLIRYNFGANCDGAGIRLGGHVIDGFTYGVDNHVSFA